MSLKVYIEEILVLYYPWLPDVQQIFGTLLP